MFWPSSIHARLAALGMGLALAPPASAAPIAWEPAADTTGKSDLISGTAVFARNGGSASVSVDGVLFTPLNLGSGYLDNLYTATGGPGTMQSTGDANFDALIRSLTYGGGTTTTVTVTGLVTSRPYRVQVFFNDQRTSTASRVMTFGDGLGHTVDVAAGSIQPGGQTNDYGRFAVGAFTSDAPTQVVKLAAQGFANAHLNAILVTGEPAPPPTNRRPNVVVLLADDEQAGALGALGNPLAHTPNLDRLVRAGVTFPNAHIMGGWSGAVCLPSRTMLMTGRSLWRVPGLAGNTFPTNQADLTLPMAFNAAGYQTLRSGKSGNTYTAANIRFGTYVYHEARDEIATSRFIDDALVFLSNRVAGTIYNPFVLYLGFDHPHDPRHAPTNLLARYGATAPDPDPAAPLDAMPPIPPNWRPKHPFDNGHLNVRDETSVEGVGTNRDERTVRNEIGKTSATIDYMDEQVGRLLARLEELDELTNTYFVVTADNGIAIGRHGLMGKQNLYEHSVGVPLAIGGPGIEPATNRALVYLHDLLPTLCELTGTPAPATVEGRSLVPLMRGLTNAVYDAQLYAYLAVQRAVREGDWKLIHYPNIHRTQLFNLADDPWETNDLSRFAAQAGRIKALAGRLRELQAEFGDHQLSNKLGRIGANVAIGCAATQSSTYLADPAYGAEVAADGAGSTLSDYTRTAIDDGSAWWQVDLGGVQDIEEVRLHNRTDALQGRLRDITVTILDETGGVAAVSAALNPGNALGGGVAVYTNGPAFLSAVFTNVPAGRFVRVTRAPDPLQPEGDADRNTLSLDEVQVFAAPYDDDGDGLADRWERRYFGGLAAASATSRSDADRASDLEEFVAGTDPLDPASVLELRIDAMPGPAVPLRWPGVTGRFYDVEWSLDGAGSWQAREPNIPGQPPFNVYTDAIGTATGALYRIRVYGP